MIARQKRPDKKNAMSIIEASKRDMKFTLSIPVSEESGATIVRNIYECFRMLGDSLLVSKGIKSEDHIMPISELMKIKPDTSRPINVVDSLRRVRHNINYYGYKPSEAEVKDAVSIAKTMFKPVLESVMEEIGKNS